jgi:hypothetical protein
MEDLKHVRELNMSFSRRQRVRCPTAVHGVNTVDGKAHHRLRKLHHQLYTQ